MTFDRPRVMGVLNVTPDSFFDGGRYFEPSVAIAHGVSMAEQGADILDIGGESADIGGESARPGALPVSLQEELDRVLPVVETLRHQVEIPISIDTSKPEVMRAAVAAGAAMINDVNALRSPGALTAAAEMGVPVCLMHMQGQPRDMQHQPSYHNVIEEVLEFLQARVDAALEAGLLPHQLVLDPGFGFGKTLAHNLELLNRLDQLVGLGYPVLAGLSRKSMLSRILKSEDEDRLAGSLTLAVLACQQGAHIIRVHDVEPTLQALRVLEAAKLERESEPGRRTA
jgi:dihydropteroate synthase